MVPLSPELRKELERLQEVVNPGIEIPLSSYVVPSYRSTEINLRKALLKIGRDARVAEWPKPFMAMRASRRTELERERRCPNHVLNAWFGHTEKIAEDHYLQVTEEDFQQATVSVLPLVIPPEGNSERPRKITEGEKPVICGGLVTTDST